MSIGSGLTVEFAEGRGEFDACLLGEFVESWERADHAREEVGGGVAACAIRARALVPHGDRVDLETLNGVDLLGDKFGELLDEEGLVALVVVVHAARSSSPSNPPWESSSQSVSKSMPSRKSSSLEGLWRWWVEMIRASCAAKTSRTVSSVGISVVG